MPRTFISTIVAVIVALAGTATADDQPKFEVVGEKLTVPGPVYFESGKAVIKAESKPTLDHVVAYMKATKKVTKLRIEVHADSTGSDRFNQALSEARALSIARALVASGVKCKRLVPVGFGSSRPIGDNKTPEGREQNRRTEFRNAAIKGKPINDEPVDGGGVVGGDPCAKD